MPMRRVNTLQYARSQMPTTQVGPQGVGHTEAALDRGAGRAQRRGNDRAALRRRARPGATGNAPVWAPTLRRVGRRGSRRDPLLPRGARARSAMPRRRPHALLAILVDHRRTATRALTGGEPRASALTLMGGV